MLASKEADWPGEFGTFAGLIGRNETGATLIGTELENGTNAGLEDRRLSYLMSWISCLSE